MRHKLKHRKGRKAQHITAPGRERVDFESPSEFAVVTVVTRSHLHWARALAVSVRETNPGVPVYICLVDRPPAPYDPGAEPGKVIFADELGIPGWKRCAFQYDAFELSCALKPFAMERVLDDGFRRVVYLDSDVQLFGPMQGPVAGAAEHSVILTPHVCRPVGEALRLAVERGLLRHGTFNGGFVAVRNSPIGRAFLGWWQSWTRSQCVSDPYWGLHVDQTPLDLAPGLFDGVWIERSEACNVAYWNLSQRTLRHDGTGRILVGDVPLVFFHFSGFEPDRPDVLSRWPHFLLPENMELVKTLTRAYGQRLGASGRATCEAWGYGYAALNDSTPIDRLWREAVRLNHPALVAVADPFDAVADPSLKKRFEDAERTVPARFEWVHERLDALEFTAQDSCRRLQEVERRLGVLEVLSGVALCRRVWTWAKRLTGRGESARRER